MTTEQHKTNMIQKAQERDVQLKMKYKELWYALGRNDEHASDFKREVQKMFKQLNNRPRELASVLQSHVLDLLPTLVDSTASEDGPAEVLHTGDESDAEEDGTKLLGTQHAEVGEKQNADTKQKGSTDAEKWPIEFSRKYSD